MSYVSKFYEIEVRDEIVDQFTDSEGLVDDMMAGLHEVRARLSTEDLWLKHLNMSIENAKKKRCQFATGNIVNCHENSCQTTRYITGRACAPPARTG